MDSAQTGSVTSIDNTGSAQAGLLDSSTDRIRTASVHSGRNGHLNGTVNSVAGAVALHRPATLPERAAQRRDVDRTRGGFAMATKRVVDLVGAVLLIAVLSPLLLLIALLIKLDSPGPILFWQRRIGRDGHPFSMLKFRTMVDGADEQKPALRHLNQAADGLFKINGDPRITRVGRWLRGTCLDELPQVLHVLTGRMSLVGPRPLVPEEDAQIQGEHRRRLSIRPGMTGVWQVGGASMIPIREMVKLDSDYIENWSLWLDCKLLLQTASYVVLRRGW
jgi:lipopolysaccharide/colanic/teichoic acid biosynthesis glycosyltransferase